MLRLMVTGHVYKTGQNQFQPTIDTDVKVLWDWKVPLLGGKPTKIRNVAMPLFQTAWHMLH